MFVSCSCWLSCLKTFDSFECSSTYIIFTTKYQFHSHSQYGQHLCVGRFSVFRWFELLFDYNYETCVFSIICDSCYFYFFSIKLILRPFRPLPILITFRSFVIFIIFRSYVILLKNLIFLKILILFLFILSIKFCFIFYFYLFWKFRIYWKFRLSQKLRFFFVNFDVLCLNYFSINYEIGFFSIICDSFNFYCFPIISDFKNFSIISNFDHFSIIFRS